MTRSPEARGTSERASDAVPAQPPAPAPGRTTLAVQCAPAADAAQTLAPVAPPAAPVQRRAIAPGLLASAFAPPVQAHGDLGGRAAGEVQAIASSGVASGGGTLPHLAAIQQSFGERHDVTGVSAHVGGAAAQACDAIGAQAYATGSSVAFSASPDLHTAAHEAAHVVQQRHGVQLKGGVGQVGDAYEQHADAVADLVVQGKSAAGLLDTMAGGARATSGPAVQRAAKTSHYGTFTDEKYEIDGAMLHMTLKFTPNDQVDATKIGFTQSIRATVAGTKVAVDPNAAARMTPGGDRIDRISSKNTPVYGSNDLGGGQGLGDTPQTNNTTANPTELNPDNGRNATYDLGHRFKGGGGAWDTKDAGMYDGPSIQGGNNSSNEFESTALALDGTQKGEYYGSVKWGWKKDGTGTISKIPFDLVSMGVPSKQFLAAATKWNAATTRGTMAPIADGTKVVDDTLAEKFTIDKNVDVAYQSSVAIGDVYYAFIKVTSDGANKNKTGYVKVAELKDKGDGGATVDLPTPKVQVTTASTALYEDSFQKKRLQSLNQGTRVKTTATKGMVSQVSVVDGADTGKSGWVASSKLANET